MAHCALKHKPENEMNISNVITLKSHHFEEFVTNCQKKRPLSEKIQRIARELDSRGF